MTPSRRTILRRGSNVKIPAERQSTRIRTQQAQVGVHFGFAREHCDPEQTTAHAQKQIVEPVDEEFSLLDTQSDSEEEHIERGKLHVNSFPEKPIVRERLPEPFTRKLTVLDLIHLIDSPWLNINPEYQRDVVWNKKAMSALIDSLIKNYYIPPIIFNLETAISDDGSEFDMKTCVDGKQRLSSIAAFVRGDIPWTDDQGVKRYYCDKSVRANVQVVGPRRDLLSNADSQALRRASLLVFEYKGLSPTQEEDLFARVQKGVPLTAAEKLRATDGEWQRLAKQFEAEFPQVVSLCENVRGVGFRNILMCFGQILEALSHKAIGIAPRSMMHLPAIEKLCSQRANECHASNKSLLRKIFGRLKEIALCYPDTLKSQSSLSGSRQLTTLELVSISVLIAKYHKTRSATLLSQDVAYLRYNLRQNAKWHQSWATIESLERARGPADQSEDASDDHAEATPLRPVPTLSRINTNVQHNTKTPTPSAESISSSTTTSSSSVFSPPETPTSSISTPITGTLLSILQSTNGLEHRARSASVDSVLGTNSYGAPPPQPVPKKENSFDSDSQSPVIGATFKRGAIAAELGMLAAKRFRLSKGQP